MKRLACILQLNNTVRYISFKTIHYRNALQYIYDLEGINVGFLQTTDMCELDIYFM